MSLDKFTCPVCGMDDCIPAYGSPKSNILVVGPFPTRDDIKTGKPFQGSVGGILRTEFQLVDLDFNRVRMCYLWKHTPNKEKKKADINAKCLQIGIDEIIKNAIGKQAILLIGAETVKTFCKISVESFNGLLIQSAILSAKIIVPCVHPNTVFAGSYGELRFAIRKFADYIKEMKHEENAAWQ